jgi:acyl-coenzyme A synthetase/AMP-(fatty) acid ligase
MALDGVERAVCLFGEGKNRIVCWYLGEIEPKEVRIRLKEKVPAYMVPGRITRVDEMPYNKNGKIDRAYFRSLIAAK